METHCASFHPIRLFQVASPSVINADMVFFAPLNRISFSQLCALLDQLIRNLLQVSDTFRNPKVDVS